MAMEGSLKDWGKVYELAWSNIATPWTVLIVGFPRNSVTEQGVRDLARDALATFEVVPDGRELATFAGVTSLPGCFDCAIVGFSSESFVELFLDAWREVRVPASVDKSKLTLVRNFQSSKRIDSREEMSRELSPGLERRFVVYVSGLPEEWIDRDKLRDYFARIVKEFKAEDVVRSVHVSPQLKDAFVELASDVVADLVFYRCKRDGLLNKISGDVFICRGEDTIPLLQQQPLRIEAAPPPSPPPPPPPPPPTTTTTTNTSDRTENTEKTVSEKTEKKASFMDFLKHRPPNSGGSGKTPDLNVPVPWTSKVEPESDNVSQAKSQAETARELRHCDFTNNDSKVEAMSICDSEEESATFDSSSADLISRDHRTSVFVSNLSGYDPRRLKEVIHILLRKNMPLVSMDAIRVTWTHGKRFAFVGLRSEKAAQLLMDAYVAHPGEAYFPDFPLEIYRHFDYERPGKERIRCNEESGPVIIEGLPRELHSGLVQGALTELLERTLARVKGLCSNLTRKFFSYFSYDPKTGTARVRFRSRTFVGHLLSLGDHPLALGDRFITVEPFGAYDPVDVGETSWKRRRPYSAEYSRAKQARQGYF